MSSNFDNGLQSPTHSEAEFRNDMLALIPHLRAFARGLCGNRDLADDLAQEALAKAWQARSSFTPGTNLKAWLFTILRNQFYSMRRRAWRETPLVADFAEQTLTSGGEQNASVNLADLSRAMNRLSDEQREALILVAAGGYSYEAAAHICHCAVGTIKSRVARARKTLIDTLDGPIMSGARKNGEEATQRIMSEMDRLAQKGENRDLPEDRERKLARY